MDSETSILSRSPELFFKTDSEMNISTRPMKGTQPRDLDVEKDKQNLNFLKNDIKNRAENLMIVDLLRNDISRISKVGTVKVPELYKVETYETVHQMTSLIIGEMNKKTTVILIAFMLVLTACSPTAGEQGPAGEAGPAGATGPAGTVSQEAIDAAVEAALAAREAEVGGTLVIYSGRKESLVADIIAEFAATSGVEVEVRYAKSAALAGTLELLSLIHI